MNCLTPDELINRDPDQLRIIDVRSPAEFREHHLEQAENIPLASLQEAIDDLKKETKELCVMCKSGMRSTQAYTLLEKADLQSLSMLQGGIDQWISEGRDVIRGRKAISIQRQVLITAGSLILLGVILGYWLHPLGFLLSGFMGAGLLLAGITDTCLLAISLAKLPWNQ